MRICNLFIYRLAEAIDLQPPVLPDDGNTTRVTTGTDVTPSPGKEPSILEPIWDDDDTKTFYESLPDLRFLFIPSIIL
jgi:regulator of nonsense transcripts 2